MGLTATTPHVKNWMDGVRKDIRLSTLKNIVKAINQLSEDKVTINDII